MEAPPPLQLAVPEWVVSELIQYELTYPPEQRRIDNTGKLNFTPLQFAVCDNDIFMDTGLVPSTKDEQRVRLLIDAGANTQVRDPTGGLAKYSVVKDELMRVG